MHNATFRFAGSFVESQNTNFVPVASVDKAIYSLQPCGYAVELFIFRYTEIYRCGEFTGCVG